MFRPKKSHLDAMIQFKFRQFFNIIQNLALFLTCKCAKEVSQTEDQINKFFGFKSSHSEFSHHSQ